jgi:hypothetical protein
LYSKFCAFLYKFLEFFNFKKWTSKMFRPGRRRAAPPRTGRPRRQRHAPPKATRRPRRAPSPCAAPRGSLESSLAACAPRTVSPSAAPVVRAPAEATVPQPHLHGHALVSVIEPTLFKPSALPLLAPPPLSAVPSAPPPVNSPLCPSSSAPYHP